MIRVKKITVLLLSNVALRAGALVTASRIAETTGVRILAQQSNGRIERGAGRVAIERVPYPIEQALKVLHDVEQMIPDWFESAGRASSPIPVSPA